MPEAHVTMDVRKPDGRISIVDIRGELTGFAEGVLMNAYDAATAGGSRVIILDFEELDYMNSTGIGLLVTLLIRANREGRTLLTCGLSQHYRTIFEITRLDDAIATFDSEDEAIRAAASLSA
jgi:anti-sigma B factor antagonist